VSAWRKLNWPARAGLVMLAGFVVVAVLAPFLAPCDPGEQDLSRRLEGPSSEHFLGCDEFGRDILCRLLFGARISLKVGVSVVGISVLVGTALGAVSGYLRGWVDEIMMRVVDIVLAFPGILLAIAIMAVLGQSLANVVLALCMTGWAPYARLARGEALRVGTCDYVLAARALGAGVGRIVCRHIIPNIISPIIVRATLGLAGVIVAESALSFLGLGVQPPTPSWGSMLNGGRSYILVAPHLVIFPGIAIMLVVLALNLVGDGLRDMLDPRQRELVRPGQG